MQIKGPASGSNGAFKCPHVEQAGVGRGAGRPGPPPVSLSDTLAAIQAQLTLQTSQMNKLADKEDVRGLSKKVDSLALEVGGHSAEIEQIKSCLLYTSDAADE